MKRCFRCKKKATQQILADRINYLENLEKQLGEKDSFIKDIKEQREFLDKLFDALYQY